VWVESGRLRTETANLEEATSDLKTEAPMSPLAWLDC